MTQGGLDDSPEFRRAKAQWLAYLERIQKGLKGGHNDDPAVAVARVVNQFGVLAIDAALQEYIENLPSSFEQRWREHHEKMVREERDIKQRTRNPKNAGRKRNRSDAVLAGTWLLVQSCMRVKGLNIRDTCKLLTKPPSRREASRWPGLLLYRDYTESDPGGASYFVKTPENLRDVYNDAVTRYRAGPESLRRHWQSLLEVTLQYSSKSLMNKLRTISPRA